MKPNIRITQIRTSLGWSIERLAYETGIPTETIRAIERGLVRDARATSKLHNAFQAAKRLAAAQQIAIPCAPMDKPLSAYQFSDDRIELIEQLKAMDPKERDALRIKLLRSLRRQGRLSAAQTERAGR
jgi:transcriptional regulator with XRE-family HTH domain